MTQKKYKKLNKTSVLNDASTEYITDNQENKIVISSITEQENDNYDYWLSLTPKQRLEVHYNLITMLYSDKLEKNRNKPYKTIIIDEYPDIIN
ncbi:MAG: hypothetical protein NTZ33_07665 [Bacteroidetes bacterium]|nr:hypothetical protein [Bacteroidota bacterium]